MSPLMLNARLLRRGRAKGDFVSLVSKVELISDMCITEVGLHSLHSLLLPFIPLYPTGAGGVCTINSGHHRVPPILNCIGVASAEALPIISLRVLYIALR